MKVIDLLNKIANGEKIPFKLKYGSTIYCFSEYHQDYVIDLSKDVIDTNVYFIKDLVGANELNDEVEVPEEDKEIEEALGIILLGQCDNWLQKRDVNIKSDFELNPYILEAITENFKSLYHKQCELIKAVNELKKGK